MIDRIDPLGNIDRDRVPAALLGIVRVEIVRSVFTGAVASLDNVLGGVTDDDGEITVLFDTSLADRFDGALTAIPVHFNNRGCRLGCELLSIL